LAGDALKLSVSCELVLARLNSRRRKSIGSVWLLLLLLVVVVVLAVEDRLGHVSELC
jgi:predicted nucleic acid-binding Zn ribbon protein